MAVTVTRHILNPAIIVKVIDDAYDRHRHHSETTDLPLLRIGSSADFIS